MNDFYTINTCIKNTQGLLKSVTPFLSNIALNDPFNLKELQPMASLLNNPEAQERLKTMQMAHSKMQALKDSPILNLEYNSIGALQSFCYQGLKIQSILSDIKNINQNSCNNFLHNIDRTKKVIPEILSDLDISTLNNKTKEIYNDISKNSDIKLKENNLKLIENFKIGIEEYNFNPNTTIKIKIPEDMKEWCCLFLVFTFVVFIIVSLSPYLNPEVINYLKAIIQGFAGSAVYDAVKKAFKTDK